MKKYTLLIISIFTLLSAQTSFAQTTTPQPKATISDKATTESITEQINTLKDKIASRVAELNLVEKRGIVGTVSDSSDTQIVLQGNEGQKRIIDVDEITKFSSLDAKKDFGISDITKGSKISILGIYNKETKRLLARFVDEINPPVFLLGAITNIDEDNFSVSVTKEDGTVSVVDIENVTKTSIYTKEDDLVKAGFSKIELGNRVSVVGYPSKSDQKRIVGTRVVLYPELQANPKIKLPKIEEPTASPTSKVSPTTNR